VPSDRFKSRARSTMLIAAVALAASVAPAVAQSARPAAGPLDAPRPAAPADADSAGTPSGLASPLAPTLSPSLSQSLAGPAGGLAAPAGNAAASPAGTLGANYGRPRPRTRLPRPYPPPRVAAPPPFSPYNPLPTLEPYRSSAPARQQLRLRPSAPGVAPPAPLPPGPTVAAAPTPKPRPRPKLEDRPYDPVGVGVGSLRLTPSLEASYGRDDNPNRVAQPTKSSALLRADGALGVRSDWDRHAFQADLRMGYSDYFQQQEASRPDGTGSFKARYDVTQDTALDMQGRFNLDTQRPGSPNVSAGVGNVTVANRPLVLSYGNSAGIAQKFNRLQLSLRGGYDRTDYEDAHYTDGSTLLLSASNYNAYYGTGRVDYELGPTVTPFVEATLDTRVHDSVQDVSGYRRDSDGMVQRGGAKVKISDLLRAEASGGYAERSYVDARLPKLRGPTIDAEILYTPSPLTTLTLRASTTLNETTASGAAGALSRSVTTELSHELLRNFTITAMGGLGFNDYQGADIRERSYTAGVRLDYKLTRSIAIRGSYTHEHLHSTSQGSDYTANVFLVGLKLQR
jgi:hypothetical protein